jgi:hypothetical protein
MSYRWFILSLTLAACSHSQSKPDVTTEKAGAPAAIASSPLPAPAAEKVAGKAECVSKSEHRFLELRAKDKGCELAYTKGGAEKIVASGSHGMNYCEKAKDKLADKLKAAGYQCK